MLETYFSTARSVITSWSAIPWFERPSAMSSSTSRSRGVSSVRTSSRPPLREQRRHDDRVDRGAALRDSLHGRDELFDVADPILEEVARTLGRVGEELHRQADLDVLREHEDSHLGVPRADRDRGLHALVAVGRREADVDDRDVRHVCRAPSRAARRRSRTRRRPRHLRRRARVQRPRGGGRCPRRSRRAWDLRSHARSAAGRAPHAQLAAERLDAVREPSQAGPAALVRSPDPVVCDLDEDVDRPARDLDAGRGRVRVLRRRSRGSPRRGSRRPPRAAPGSREPTSTLRRTGTAACAASCSSATPRPWPLTTAGWRPRATSRSSSSDAAISPPRRPQARVASGSSPSSLLEAGSARGRVR